MGESIYDTSAELDEAEKLIARTHAIVFLPAIVIALIYGGCWLLLHQLGRGDGGLARLCFFVSVVAPPVFALFAFMRYTFGRIYLAETDLLIGPDWPWQMPRRLPLARLTSAEVVQNRLEAKFGAGALRLQTRGGEAILVRDCAAPDAVARALMAAR